MPTFPPPSKFFQNSATRPPKNDFAVHDFANPPVTPMSQCPQRHFGGRRSVDAVSPSAFSSHGATGNTEEFQNFRFSACQHFPLRVSPPRVASLLRYAPVAHPGLHICLSLWTCAIARVFAPAHVALRAALRQGWFAFLPECLTLRATHVAYRANPRLLGSQPAPAGMCSREPSAHPPVHPAILCQKSALSTSRDFS
jgi:hypothetical protein